MQESHEQYANDDDGNEEEAACPTSGGLIARLLSRLAVDCLVRCR